MRESLIEKDGVKFAEARGWSVYKWASPGTTGVHDRLFFKGHLVFSIEYKTTGKKATPKQRKVAEDLKSKGIPCRCCDTVQKSRDFISAMTDLVDKAERLSEIKIAAHNILSFDP